MWRCRFFQKDRVAFCRALSLGALALSLAANGAHAASLVVISLDDAGPGSLRQAILDANALPSTDTIEFALPPALAGPGGVFTFGLLSELPEITDPVRIDGRSQPGWSGDPILELDGTSVAAPASGLTLGPGSDGSSVEALAVVGFAVHGVHLRESGRHRIRGNHLGVRPDGATPRGNEVGITLTASDRNAIGGGHPGQGNLLSANRNEGVAVVGSSYNLIQGNVIGADAGGGANLGNGGQGVELAGGAEANLVLDNRIAFNDSGIDILAESRRNVLVGNSLSGHGRGGVTVAGDGDNTLVGLNTIFANGFYGIGVLNGSDRVWIGYNRIGVDDGGAARGNFGSGILVGTVFSSFPPLQGALGDLEGPADTRIVGNEIAHNFGAGVLVGGDLDSAISDFLGVPFDDGFDGAAWGTAVVYNSFSSNAGLGIDLTGASLTIPLNPVVTFISNDADGVTANDAGDSDGGANGLQNHPELISVERAGSWVRVTATLDSAPNTGYLVQLYAASAPDPSGYGEGEVLLKSRRITTDSAGHAQFVLWAKVHGLPAGAALTATATVRGGGGPANLGSSSELAGNVPLL